MTGRDTPRKWSWTWPRIAFQALAGFVDIVAVVRQVEEALLEKPANVRCIAELWRDLDHMLLTAHMSLDVGDPEVIRRLKPAMS